MSSGRLAILPTHEGRIAARQVINLPAHLREAGTQLIDVQVIDLSRHGFRVATQIPLVPGGEAWLKLPGVEPRRSCVVWSDQGRTGFEFFVPLDAATLEALTGSSPAPPKSNAIDDHHAAPSVELVRRKRRAIGRPSSGRSLVREFLDNRKGATAIEYGLIAALIAVAAIVAMQSLGTGLSTTFNNVSSAMK